MDSLYAAANWDTKDRLRIRTRNGGRQAGDAGGGDIAANVGILNNAGYASTDTTFKQVNGSAGEVTGGIVGGGGSGGGSGVSMMEKRKRGRPRKYRPEESLRGEYMESFLEPPPGFPLLTPRSGENLSGSKTGNGKEKTADSPGEFLGSTAEEDFTPHVVTVSTGEDIAAKILAFAQKANRGVFVLAANGPLSSVTLCKLGSCSSDLLTFEGCFEILTLRGSYTASYNDIGIKTWTGGLSVSLVSRSDGRFIVGGVASLLMAASPIKVIVGSFAGNSCDANKRKHQQGSNPTATFPFAPGHGNIISNRFATTNK